MDDTASLVWFRNDLRLSDNTALAAAAARGRVVPVFIWCPGEDGGWAPGSASRWWLHQSLVSLDAELRQRGSRLILRQGESRAELRKLARETGASAVYRNRDYEPARVNRDAAVAAALKKDGIATVESGARLLWEPEEIRTREGGPYQVFGPFWRACREAGEPDQPHSAPRALEPPTKWPASAPLQDLRLVPEIDWAAGIRRAWEPGTRGAVRLLEQLIDEKLNAYPEARDVPAEDGTSRLSPHLHFGEISIRQVWHAVRRHGRAGEAFLGELGWREFAHHLLVNFPHTPEQPLHEEFRSFQWQEDSQLLRAWQKGRTGYPLIDAGMRQLWTTGWMHNRVRMVVGSFLVKDLLQPWQEGARWFWDTLVDADLANNTLGWQWIAGCGADAAPYFRVFNPVTQAQKFDPDGKYVRRWIPELAALPGGAIHQPWKAGPLELLETGIKLGETYPLPIVDHSEARERALRAYAALS